MQKVSGKLFLCVHTQSFVSLNQTNCTQGIEDVPMFQINFAKVLPYKALLIGNT